VSERPLVADDHVKKPFSAADLAAKVRETLDRAGTAAEPMQVA